MEPFPLFGLQSSHLNICYYHQDLHRRPLRPGSRPGFYSDRRALLLIGAWSLPRRPVSLRASTRVSSGFAPLRHSSPSFGSRQVCSHSNPSQKIRVGRRCNPQGDPTNQLPCALRVYSPVDSHTCQTPWSVFKTGRMGSPQGRRPERARAETRHEARAAVHNRNDDVSTEHFNSPGLGHRCNPRRSMSRVDRRTGSHRSTSDRDTSPAPIRFPPDNFKHSLTLFSSPFHLSLAGPGTTGLSPSLAPPSRGTWARSATEDASPDYNSNAEGDRFSWWAFPGSLAVTRGILVSFFSSAY
ncbi:hypothetical protein VNO80_35169 [Phaseolus coccineus]|uniref:Uncharacterized protein n=1 Tax=Phaseolus coccineus TaxID=3886 RepID=A0AAN9Q2J9_PHACN